jgi:hypothetical protein
VIELEVLSGTAARSLRPVFCTVALSTWKLDVSRVAWHANHRITLEMCCPGPASAGLPKQ